MMEQPAESHLLSAYDLRWKNYRSQYKTCRIEFSEEAVHDLRVTARRLLAVLDIARALAPHPRIKKVRRVLNDMIEELDELRDVQVMLVEISENLDALPELKVFQKSLKKREAKLLRSAYKHIKQNGLSEMSARIKKIRESLVELEAKADAFESQLLEVTDNAYASAEQAYCQIDAALPSSIHRLRLKFKKFRYLVEIIHPYVNGYPLEYMERMHNYQGMMGNIQDAEVFLTSFAEYTDEHGEKIKKERVAGFYRQRLQVLIADFVENKGEFSIFWNQTKQFVKADKNETIRDTTRHRSGSRGYKVRGGQPAAPDKQGKGKNKKDRAGIVGVGDPTEPDPEQSHGADDGNGGDPRETA